MNETLRPTQKVEQLPFMTVNGFIENFRWIMPESGTRIPTWPTDEEARKLVFLPNEIECIELFSGEFYLYKGLSVTEGALTYGQLIHLSPVRHCHTHPSTDNIPSYEVEAARNKLKHTVLARDEYIDIETFKETWVAMPSSNDMLLGVGGGNDQIWSQYGVTTFEPQDYFWRGTSPRCDIKMWINSVQKSRDYLFAIGNNYLSLEERMAEISKIIMYEFSRKITFVPWLKLLHFNDGAPERS